MKLETRISLGLTKLVRPSLIWKKHSLVVLLIPGSSCLPSWVWPAMVNFTSSSNLLLPKLLVYKYLLPILHICKKIAHSNYPCITPYITHNLIINKWIFFRSFLKFSLCLFTSHACAKKNITSSHIAVQLGEKRKSMIITCSNIDLSVITVHVSYRLSVLYQFKASFLVFSHGYRKA